MRITRSEFVVVAIVVAILASSNVCAGQLQTPAGLVEAFFTAYPTGHVDSGARPTHEELRMLERFLSSTLHSSVRNAVAYRDRWKREHPDQPAHHGLPPEILKPPFGEGFDFAGCPDGARTFKIVRTDAKQDGSWEVIVRFWYDPNLTGWENVVVVKTEDGRYVIEDVLFESEPNEPRPRLSQILGERWK